MRIKDMVWGINEVKDVELDQVPVVKAGPVDGAQGVVVWHLPGGFTTSNYDAVRDYCSAIKRDRLHLKGIEILEGLKDDIASHSSCD